jgi:DNA-binding response OmpR family regulator
MIPGAQTILIVEDEQTIVDVLSNALASEGYTTIACADEREGLALALEHRPNLILLDVVMPLERGVSLLGELRADSWGRHVPVIVLTNMLDAEHLVETERNGIFDFVVKGDTSVEEIIEKTKHMLGLRERVVAAAV